jgi:4-diphosphocytidyl-2-C-methyl-D-erythritol kinase
VIVFPNSKINLGLHILRKRADGFHDLETVFYPISLQDALEIIHHPTGSRGVEFNLSGFELDGNKTDNICLKAYDLLKEDFKNLPAVRMHLHKSIPAGGGLGGGSADGAFALLLLNKKFNLGLSEEMLINYAVQLGSDCPFFIKNIPCYATGRGEKMEGIELDLSGYKMIVINPGIHISTKEAFAMINPADDRVSLKEIIMQPVSCWKADLKNDFEEAVFRKYPEIGKIKDSMYQHGAVYASMSGSGSTVYGLFEKSADPRFDFPSHYFVKSL